MTALYFSGWSIYGKKHFLKDLNTENISEVTYAFFGVGADGSLEVLDPYEWSDKAFSASESVSGVADTWEPGAQRGNQNQFKQLAEANPDLKMTIAFGGWSKSKDISTAMLDENRDNLIKNMVEMTKEYPWITGFDMDWEFPGGGGAAGNVIRSQDGANYAKFVEELKESLDVVSKETGKEYTVSVASPPGVANVDTFGFELGVAEHADVINFMAYDYHGGWETTTGLQSNMFDTYSGHDHLGIAATMKSMISKGVDVGKVNVGIPLYARGWTVDPSTTAENALNAPATGLAKGQLEKGIYDSKYILAQIEADPKNWTVVYNVDAMGAYAYNSTNGEMVSIETRTTAALKSAWAKHNDFHGLMFWDSSGDVSEGDRSIVEAVNDVWEGKKTVAEIMKNDPIQFDLFTGDGHFYDMLTLDAAGNALSEAEADARIEAESGMDAKDITADKDKEDTVVQNTDVEVVKPQTNVTETQSDENHEKETTTEPTIQPSPTVQADESEAPAVKPADIVELVEGGQTLTISWKWGSDQLVQGFDVKSDKIDFVWMQPTSAQFSHDADGNLVISIPSNSQSYTFKGVGASDLSAANFNALDVSMQNTIAALLEDSKEAAVTQDGQETTGVEGEVSSAEQTETVTEKPATDEAVSVETVTEKPATDEAASAETVEAQPETSKGVVYDINWKWGHDDHIVFDVENDKLDFSWMNANNVEFTVDDSGIKVEIVGNQQTYFLENVDVDDLSEDNFIAEDESLQAEIEALLL